MNWTNILGIIVGALGVVFGVVLKFKNNKITKLELENSNISKDYMIQKSKAETAEKEAEIAKSAIKLSKAVTEAVNEVAKPNEDEESTGLSDEEKTLARDISSDPFAVD